MSDPKTQLEKAIDEAKHQREITDALDSGSTEARSDVHARHRKPEQQPEPLTFTATCKVDPKRIWEIVSGAWYSGSGHWAIMPEEIEFPFPENWSRVFRLNEETAIESEGDSDLNGKTEWTLDLETVTKGLQVYVDTYPEEIPHLLSIDEWSGDGPESDRFIQCCLFGKVVFG